MNVNGFPYTQEKYNKCTERFVVTRATVYNSVNLKTRITL